MELIQKVLACSFTNGELLILRKWGAAPSCTKGEFPARFIGLANDWKPVRAADERKRHEGRDALIECSVAKPPAFLVHLASSPEWGVKVMRKKIGR